MISSLSILIPAYNVSQTLPEILEKSRIMGKSVAKKIEIIVVDDGSTDETPNLLIKLKWPELRVITHEKNQGYGMSIRDLYNAGVMEWMVTLPGDDQIDPSEVKKLVPFIDSADMIMGKREIRGDHIKRRIQSKTYNFLLKLLFTIPTSDVNTIRLMRQSIMNTVKLTMTSPFVDAELVLKASRNGFVIKEVPIHHKNRITPGATGGKFFQTILPTIIDMFSFISSR